MTTVHDLISEALLSWRDKARKRWMTTLPGSLAKLSSGELEDFPRVRTHQFHPWSMFLTQLAAIAMQRAGKTDLPASEPEWREMLLALTEGAHEPWCLFVGDLRKPAFFQPPVPEGSVADWDAADRPDDVDILVTSKAHDVKEARLDAGIPELWAYALTTLQTMQGYPGRGYTPISRMKGGYGNRGRVGLAPDVSVSSRFRRDVAVLLEAWPVLLARGFNDKGIALVWTVPWDGSSSLGIEALTPHFIEICRRIRCIQVGGALRCAGTTSSARRCISTIENGDVGDPWIPVERDAGALTIGPSGFHYELLSHLLLGDDFEPAAAQVLRSGDPDPMLFFGSALARGQGKTEGLHERVLPISAEVKRRLGQPDQRAALGRRAAAHVERAKKMRSNVLFPALKALASGGKTMDDSFSSRVDEVFFRELFRTIAEEDQPARLEWERLLVAMASEELQRAIARCSVADAQRYRAIAAAEALFHGCLQKHFSDAVAQRHSPKEQEGVQP